MESKLLYHVFDVENLESILEQGGLLSYNECQLKDINYINIAHRNIQKRRSRKPVPLPPYGNLHDYVPFYFAPRSPMLYAIYKNQVEEYDNNQEQIIYVVSRTDKIDQRGLDCVFSDGHAEMGFTKFYKNFNYFNKIDWDVMESKFWFDNEEDPDRKRRRQAEFLVYKEVPIEVFLGFAVKNSQIKDKVKQILHLYNINKPVAIRRNWYY